jgi:hypothetical protein
VYTFFLGHSLFWTTRVRVRVRILQAVFVGGITMNKNLWLLSKHRLNWVLLPQKNVTQKAVTFILYFTVIINLTFRGPRIVIYYYNKSQQNALFLNSILVYNSTSTCFGQTYCPSLGVLILYSQQLVFVVLKFIKKIYDKYQLLWIQY